MRILFCTLAMMGSCLIMAGANAQVHKCTDAQGKVSFTQTPCEKGSKAEDVKLRALPPVQEMRQNPNIANFTGTQENARVESTPLADPGRRSEYLARKRQEEVAALTAQCQAQRRVGCDKSNTIDTMRRENTPITDLEAARYANQRRRAERDRY